MQNCLLEALNVGRTCMKHVSYRDVCCIGVATCTKCAVKLHGSHLLSCPGSSPVKPKELGF